MKNGAILLTIFLILTATELPLHSAKSSSALYREGAKQALNGQIDEAISKFLEAVRISPYYALGHYGLGKCYLYKQGRLEDAVKHLKKSTVLDKRNPKGFFYLGMAYLLSKKYIPAIHAFDEAYKQDKSYIEALYNIGVIYDIMRSHHRSSRYFEKYIARKQKDKQDILF